MAMQCGVEASLYKGLISFQRASVMLSKIPWMYIYIMNIAI